MKKKLNRGVVLLLVSVLVLVGVLLGVQVRNEKRLQRYRPMLEESTQKVLAQLQEREGQLSSAQLVQEMRQWNLGLSEQWKDDQGLVQLIEQVRSHLSGTTAPHFQLTGIQYHGRKEGMDCMQIHLRVVRGGSPYNDEDRYIQVLGEIHGDSAVIRMVDWMDFLESELMQRG